MATPQLGESLDCAVLLYYCYTTHECVETELSFQTQLCTKLNLNGRIRVSRQGINGSVSGTVEECNRYIKDMESHNIEYANIHWKKSLVKSKTEAFKDMQVVVRNTLVNLGTDTNLDAATGTHLSPQEWHEYLIDNKDNYLLLDVRNEYESRIGYFESAVKAPIRQFSDLPPILDSLLQQPKPVLMYCTGGIRCETAAAYLSERNHKVYQLKGGIHSYLEEFKDDGNSLYRGHNYVFDDRLVSHSSRTVVGDCIKCQSSTSDHYKFQRRCKFCRLLVVVCENCSNKDTKDKEGRLPLLDCGCRNVNQNI